MVSHSEKPRALITGIGGFTGRYLAAELADAGYRVFGTTHENEPAVPNTFSVNLCDRVALQEVVRKVKPQVIAHLAAISFVAHGDAEAIYRVNILGTRNLLEALAELNETPHSVLLASSANIYGNSGVEVIDENVLPSPANDYAVSKLGMEYMARLWMDRMPITLVRPFNYTGVGQSPNFLIPKIVAHFQRRESVIELGNIEIERDFSDVRMIAKVYRALLQRSPKGEVINVCSGSCVSLKRILALMTSIANHEIEVKINPLFLRKNDVQRLQGDSRKLQAFVPDLQAIAIENTLRWMYEASIGKKENSQSSLASTR